MTAKRQNPKPAPPPKDEADSGRPETGSGKGRRDVVGRIPDNIDVDPDITLGHPGYEESGESEIIPSPQAPETTAPPKKT